jgi:hypothetical protein
VESLFFFGTNQFSLSWRLDKLPSSSSTDSNYPLPPPTPFHLFSCSKKCQVSIVSIGEAMGFLLELKRQVDREEEDKEEVIVETIL